MKRKLLKVLIIAIGILVILIIGGFLTVAYYFAQFMPEKDSPHHVADFIRKNPDRASIYFVRNGKVLAHVSSDKMFPLASTVKTIIAIEYARQVGQGRLDARQPIDLTELDKFYVAGTDGDAHPAWLKYSEENGLIQDGKIALEEVAKGMIWFSSNANTEFLMDKLGLDNINRNLPELGLAQHQKLYPIVSSLFLLDEFSSRELEQMPMEDYVAKSFAVHEKLKNGTMDKSPSSFITRLYQVVFTDKQKIWSERLPAATTREYASIMKKINDRNFFDEKTQTALDGVMEVYFRNPQYLENFTHMGGKGGSTLYILTKTLYATDQDGNKTELCYFFNDLKLGEINQLQERIKDFERLILTDENFRNEILETLNDK